MSVTQVYQALGSFEFEFLGNVPRDVLDTVQYFGHIAFVPGRMDPKQYGDNTLAAARYVGVVRRVKIADDGRTNLVEDDIRVSGVGMEFWLGDEDGKGPVIEAETLFSSNTFTSVITALCPTSLTLGTIYSVLGSYSGRHQYETPRSAIQYVCDTMSTSSVPVSYRVTNQGVLTAGPESNLFVTNPTCLIIKKGVSQGEDMTLRALQTTVDLDQDMEDFTTRVVMIAEESEEQLATGSADIATVAPGVNVYKDLQGNPLKLTRLVSESDTIESNADTRAELALRTYIDPHRQLTLAADDYDIHGSFEVGDYVWVYDPDSGLVDTNNELYVRGLRINPMKLRVTEADFPITEGYTVAFRDANGVWTDLTDYIHWEEDQPSNITIGDFERNLTDSGESAAARVSSFVQPDSSIPDAPAWTTGSFTTANYLDGNGFAKAAITVVWSVPLNQDASNITDGDHYEINFRVQGQTDWSVLNVAWGTNSLRVADLAVATTYEFRVRGIDKSNNLGTWSSTTTKVASADTIAPSTPAAPTVAASTIAIQVVHNLGKASSGSFNLESDLAALEVHMGSGSGFTASSGTYVGSMRANQGMMTALVPAVETFQVASTAAVFFKVIAVDTSGNKSAASTAATTTATLVDDAHISDLTVTKVTAGTISSAWLIGANIQTASSGQRVVLNSTGLHAFNSGGTEVVTISASAGSFTLKSATTGARIELDNTGLRTYSSGGTNTVNIASADGSVSIIGQITSGTSGKRLEIMPTSTYLPELRFYANSGSNYSFINSFSTGTNSGMGVNSGTFTDTAVTVQSTLALTDNTSYFAVVRADTLARFGGFVWITASSARIGYNRAGVDGGQFFGDDDSAKVGWDDGTTSTANYMLFNSGRTRHIGMWANNVNVDNNEGIFTGSISATGSIGGRGVTWGPTMDSPMYGVATIRDSPANYAYMSATPTTTGCTFDFAIATTGASAVHFWCWRM